MGDIDSSWRVICHGLKPGVRMAAKKCKWERTLDFDYISTNYKIKILHEYESFNKANYNSKFTTPPSLPFNYRRR